MFESLSDKLTAVFDNLKRRGKLSESDVDAAMREVKLALLEADVNYAVVRSFTNRVKERAIGAEVSKALNPAQQVIKIVNEELISTLGQPVPLNLKGEKPHVLMMVGLQGSGKTTAAAKIAKKNYGRVVNESCWSRRIFTVRLPSSNCKLWVSVSMCRSLPSLARNRFRLLKKPCRLPKKRWLQRSDP